MFFDILYSLKNERFRKIMKIIIVWIGIFIGVFLLELLKYAVLFKILKLHKRRVYNAPTENQILKKYEGLTIEEKNFIATYTMYFGWRSFYLYLMGEWEVLYKYFWRISLNPLFLRTRGRTIRRFVWESRDWSSFEVYRKNQLYSELRARIIGALITVGVFALMWFIVINYGEEIADFTKRNTIRF